MRCDGGLGDLFGVNASELDQGLALLDPEDLAALLAVRPEGLVGAVLRLNRAPRYHNSLNAVVIAELILRIREAMDPRAPE